MADERAVDPDVEVDAAAVRMHLEPARDRRVGRLHVGAGAEHAPPAERVDDERRGQLAAVRPHRVAPRRTARRLDHRDLEAGVALLPQLLAQRPVVERATSSTAAGSGPSRAACGSAMHGSSWRIARSHAHRRAATASARRTREVWRSPIS